ncbi:uncharacterized protein [Periplaneta americana]|uniref:uncharacterized protein n=1 Tax=Periplaneta americana TaxID=6978 RepID=UPI0037E852AF
MSSNYQRKTDRQLFTREQLMTAQERIASGSSVRAAAKFVGVHEATLRKRLKAGTVPSSLGRFKSTFSKEEEEALVARIKTLDSKFYGITRKQLMTVVFQYATQNKIAHPFNKNKKMAGEKWVRNFCKRHSLTLRQPEKCSLGRAIGFNPVQFDRFHENLKKVFDENPALSASDIFNMDETSVPTVPNKLPKIISPRGKRVVSKVVSQERGVSVTAVCCVSAAGYYVPPALIFPRKRYKPEFCDRTPPDTLGMVSDSGFINSELFMTWLEHFRKHVVPSQQKKKLLILDNHISHCSLAAIEYCREKGIILLSLPPHASHKLQPLDVSFFGPLKKSLSEECDRWVTNHPGRPITIYQVGEIFEKAYSKTASIQIAVKSFQVTGIFPQDPSAFKDDDFMPSSVTDREVQEPSEEVNLENEAGPSSVGQNNEESPLQTANNLGEGKNHPSGSNVSPKDLLPSPKGRREKKRGNRSKSSAIMTSSPFKKSLEDCATVSKRPKRKAAKKLSFPTEDENDEMEDIDDDDDDDPACIYCNSLYSGSKYRENWIQCQKCRLWAHTECAGINRRAKTYVCELCK